MAIYGAFLEAKLLILGTIDFLFDLKQSRGWFEEH